MEPVSLIVAALVAGAAKAVGDVVPDAYIALKELIKDRFAGEPKAEIILEEYESDPETYEVALKKKLAEAGAGQDEKILQVAQELLKQLHPKETIEGKYKVDFQGEVKGAQIGDHNTQTNTFN